MYKKNVFEKGACRKIKEKKILPIYLSIYLSSQLASYLPTYLSFYLSIYIQSENYIYIQTKKKKNYDTLGNALKIITIFGSLFFGEFSDSKDFRIFQESWQPCLINFLNFPIFAKYNDYRTLGEQFNLEQQIQILSIIRSISRFSQETRLHFFKLAPETSKPTKTPFIFGKPITLYYCTVILL